MCLYKSGTHTRKEIILILTHVHVRINKVTGFTSYIRMDLKQLLVVLLTKVTGFTY